jgi:hypothetical protein
MAADPTTTAVPPAVAAAAAAKSTAKQKADATVATNQGATHSVKMAVTSPEVVAGASTGALIGTFLFPGLGTAAGAVIGGTIERYQILGGPVSKIVAKVRTKFQRKPTATTTATSAATGKKPAAPAAPAAGATPITAAAPPPGATPSA